MKIQFSLPKDEQFYNSYAQLVPTLRRLGILSQVVSAATEIGVIFAIIRASLADFMPQYATHTAIIGAIAATLFLELGLRQFLPHAARAVLYKHYTGLHLPMTLFIWLTCAVLLLASGGLSFRGSREMVAAVAPRPTLATDAAHLAAFRQDSATIAGRYAGQMAAIAARSSAEVGQQRQALARLQAKERAENRHYTTGKAAIREKIAAIEATAAAELARLATAQGEELAKAQARLLKGRDQVEASNTEATAAAASKVNSAGLGLGWFTLLALFVLIVAVVLEEIAAKGAGIEAFAQPTQWHFSQGIGAELANAITGVWQHHARTLIRRIAEAVPPPPPPADPVPLWDIDPAMPRRQKQPGSASPRRAIGYKQPPDDEATPNAMTNNAMPTDNAAPNAMRYRMADCQHCGKPFEAKTTWHIFCTEDCRLAFHAARHGGQKYDPKKKFGK